MRPQQAPQEMLLGIRTPTSTSMLFPRFKEQDESLQAWDPSVLPEDWERVGGCSKASSFPGRVLYGVLWPTVPQGGRAEGVD